MPALKPSSSTASPCTITMAATGWVVACTPRRLTSGRRRARTAATTTGKTGGGQPAMTALTATVRAVATPKRGATVPSTSSGLPPWAPSMASTRPGVGATTGRPSPQRWAANHSVSVSWDSSARSNTSSPARVSDSVMTARYALRSPSALDPDPVGQQTAVVERGHVLHCRLEDDEQATAIEREEEQVVDQRLLGRLEVVGADAAVDRGPGIGDGAVDSRVAVAIEVAAAVADDRLGPVGLGVDADVAERVGVKVLLHEVGDV